MVKAVIKKVDIGAGDLAQWWSSVLSSRKKKKKVDMEARVCIF